MEKFSIMLTRGDIYKGTNSMYSIRKNFKLVGSLDGQYLSRLRLNDGWIVHCFWKEYSSRILKPHLVKFQRFSTADEVTISGTFSSRKIHMGYSSPTRTEQKFSNVMESGDSCVVIYVNNGIFKMCYAAGSVLRLDLTIKSGSCCCRKKPANVHLVELSNDFGRLLEPETSCYADVNLKCGDASIPAHKVILSARSPVFAAMFRNPMKEARTNEVVINDIDATVLRIMLTYVYTAKLPVLTVSLASDVLVAADKYQMIDLKKLCCEILMDNISIENVLRIICLGELYDGELKSFAINYICNTCTCRELTALKKNQEMGNPEERETRFGQ